MFPVASAQILDESRQHPGNFFVLVLQIRCFRRLRLSTVDCRLSTIIPLVQGIAVLDAGGQYCHLLARRVREVGVQSHVLPIDTSAAQLAGIGRIIISGGPRSVTEAGSPRVNPSILSMGVPILGICYGHQLLAATMPGGVVKPSYSREYGLAKLKFRADLKVGTATAGTPTNGIADGSEL